MASPRGTSCAGSIRGTACAGPARRLPARTASRASRQSSCGRWTKVPGSAQGDGTRDDLHLVGGRGRRPGGGQIRINGRWLAATQAQQTRIAVTKRAMDRAVAEAKRLDPRWRPRSQLTETVEGYIRANEANRLEAELKIYELTGRPPNLGPFAVEWLPIPPNGRALNSAERLRLDAIGQKYGCHGCGSTTNLTPNRHSVADHQIPTALGVPTRILPHCVHCSALQGSFVRGFLWRLNRD